MTLFLTSSPCEDNVPAGCDLPCIYFERNAFVANLRRFIRPGGRFLAIAAWKDDHARNDEMAQTFAGCFAWHGMAFSGVQVLDSRNQAHAADLVANSDVILLAGGHVPTQNEFFQQNGLRKLLAGYPGVIMGVSAGSMNAAGTVYAQPEEAGEATDPAYRRFIPGLGLTEVNILPHYHMVRDNIIDGLRLFEDVTYADSMGRCFFALPDGSYFYQDEEGLLLCGKAYRIKDGILELLTRDSQVLDMDFLK